MYFLMSLCHYVDCLSNLVRQVFKMANLRNYKMSMGENPLKVGDLDGSTLRRNGSLNVCLDPHPIKLKEAAICHA